MFSSKEKTQKTEAEGVNGDEMIKFDGFYFVPDYDDFNRFCFCPFFFEIEKC